MWRSIKKVVLTFALISCTALSANAADNVTTRYTFVQDGELSKQVHLPTCEWYPTKSVPDAMVLAIHGLTLHGKRYEIIGRTFAAENALGSVYVVAPDMRGFGRNRNELHIFCEGSDCKRKIDYPKSVDDMCKLAEIMHKKYPNVPLYLMGESLGATVCLAVAAKRPDLFDGIVMSGVAETVNPLMFNKPGIVGAGLFAVFIDPKFNMRLGVFMKQLVSNEPDICQEMMDDPLVPKKMTLAELIRTDKFISKTNKFASKVKPDLPILLLQGSEDKCVVPNAVANLAEHIHSSDQTMKWLYAHGHLLLETDYVRPATIDAVTDWFDARTPAHKQILKTMQEDLRSLGGKQLASDEHRERATVETTPAH
jgi:acylglycerol lipase